MEKERQEGSFILATNRGYRYLLGTWVKTTYRKKKNIQTRERIGLNTLYTPRPLKFHQHGSGTAYLLRLGESFKGSGRATNPDLADASIKSCVTLRNELGLPFSGMVNTKLTASIIRLSTRFKFQPCFILMFRFLNSAASLNRHSESEYDYQNMVQKSKATHNFIQGFQLKKQDL